MFDSSVDMFGSVMLSILMILIGLATFGFGYTGMGRIWPHPRAFWGLLAASFILMGFGFSLMGWLNNASGWPPQVAYVLRTYPIGYDILLFALLLTGVWGTWAYLEQKLYSAKAVYTPDLQIIPVRESHLQRRHLAAAAAMMGAMIGMLTIALLFALSEDTVVTVVLLLKGGVIGGVSCGVTLAVLLLLFRRDIVTQ